MTKKNIEDMFNDPSPDPSYPEEEDEFFEMLLEDGLTPADIHGPDSALYEEWLKKREKAAKKLKADGAA